MIFCQTTIELMTDPTPVDAKGFSKAWAVTRPARLEHDGEFCSSVPSQEVKINVGFRVPRERFVSLSKGDVLNVEGVAGRHPDYVPIGITKIIDGPSRRRRIVPKHEPEVTATRKPKRARKSRKGPTLTIRQLELLLEPPRPTAIQHASKAYGSRKERV